MIMLKKIIVSAIAVMIIVGVFTGIAARVQEDRIRRIKPGMHKTEVEKLLGAGSPDISSSGKGEKWPPERKQYSYKGNPSLWYLRWEDELIVGYTNEIVSDTERCGL